MRYERDLNFYLEKAIEHQGLKSHNQLGKLLGFKSSAMTYWRNGRALPSDDNMIELARMAGIDPAIALLDLNMWRSTGTAQKTYRKILDGVAGAMAIAVLGWLFTALPDVHESAVMALCALPAARQHQRKTEDTLSHPHYRNYTLSHYRVSLSVTEIFILASGKDCAKLQRAFNL